MVCREHLLELMFMLGNEPVGFLPRTITFPGLHTEDNDDIFLSED
jgi:hypothetical protein